eukprot:gb/GECH01012225.1/.p1 GENE.gb/GECH01012225.1/~~gb/GECH01012225.1/.p1  ORF type:complete len:253 (+),score=56.94 gb/GECH01012225.1/:1-759(+)
MSSLPKNFGSPCMPMGSFRRGSLREPFIIGVAGGTASGKTTVCHKIVESLKDDDWRVTVISQDSFYKSLTEEELELANSNQYNFDHPDSFDYDLIEQTISDLKSGKKAEIPNYDFKTHTRSTETSPVYGADIIIFEGILVFYASRVLDLFDLKIFVDTDADTRLVRRIRRDIADRGRDLEGVLAQYEKFVKPSFDEYVQPTKKHADIIIPRGGTNIVAIDLMTQHIKLKLRSNGEENNKVPPLYFTDETEDI